MKKQQEHSYVSMVVPYVLGELSSTRREILEQHLRTGCHLCMMELAETEEALHGLALVLPASAPPPGVRHEVMTKTAATIHPGAAEERRSNYSPFQRSLFGYTSLFLIIAILAGFWIYSENLITTIDSQGVRIVGLRDELRQKEELLAVLQAPRIEVVTMAGVRQTSAYGRIIWDPAKKVALFQASNLPSIPEDKDYQLWIIRKKKPEPAGVFAVRDEKDRSTVFKVLGWNVPRRKDADAFAVTLEPKGGLASPSGQMYLIGNIR